MNTGISSSYPGSHTLDNSLIIIPQMMAEDENSIISWFNNDEEPENEDDNITSNFEDFIDIDMAPDVHETMISSRYDDVIDPDREDACLRNFKEILVSHRHIFRDNCRNVINRNIKEEERMCCLKSKIYFVESFVNTRSICCYNEGIVGLLQIFDRIDSFIYQYIATISECNCSKIENPRTVSQIGYALETAGHSCKQCDMDYIIHHLNSTFLTNVARAQFFSIKDIVDSILIEEEEIELGATSSDYNFLESFDPETGWLRRWLKPHWAKEAVIAFIYSEMVNVENTQRNKVMFRFVDYYTDEAFHLTIPMETVTDEEIERRLLQDEISYILKSEMLKYEHRPEEFECLINHRNDRIHDMNVLGQIVGMFREQTVENFRDVSRPMGVHKVKVPNMHRHGVLVVVPLSETIGRDRRSDN